MFPASYQPVKHHSHNALPPIAALTRQVTRHVKVSWESRGQYLWVLGAEGRPSFLGLERPWMAPETAKMKQYLHFVRLTQSQRIQQCEPNHGKTWLCLFSCWRPQCFLAATVFLGCLQVSLLISKGIICVFFPRSLCFLCVCSAFVLWPMPTLCSCQKPQDALGKLGSGNLSWTCWIQLAGFEWGPAFRC